MHEMCDSEAVRMMITYNVLKGNMQTQGTNQSAVTLLEQKTSFRSSELVFPCVQMHNQASTIYALRIGFTQEELSLVKATSVAI